MLAELCELAFSHVDLNYRDFVVEDPKFYRENDHYDLIADSTAAAGKLGWRPTMDFSTMVRKMVDHDMFIIQNQLEG